MCLAPERASSRYCSMFISRTRLFASFTNARKAALCCLGCVLMARYSLHLRAYALQFGFDSLISPVEVIHTIDERLALGNQGGEHERSARPQIRRNHLRAR